MKQAVFFVGHTVFPEGIEETGSAKQRELPGKRGHSRRKTAVRKFCGCNGVEVWDLGRNP